MAMWALQLPVFLLGVSVSSAADPKRPVIQKTFNATVHGYSWATGAINMSSSGRLIFSEAIESQVQDQAIPDGRHVQVIFNYENDTSKAGVFSLQPFFDEHVCFIYPLPQGRSWGKPMDYGLALEEAWCQQASPCMAEYQQSTYKGMGSIFGVPCQQWEYGMGNDTIQYCVTHEGHLLSVNRTVNDPKVQVVSRMQLSEYSATVDQGAFAISNRSSCVDLRAARGNLDDFVNDERHINDANLEAEGIWFAGHQDAFEGKTQREASERLGLNMNAFDLAPPTPEHLRARLAATRNIPKSFDARNEWGSQCNSITTIRNQGDCGGCWAFSAVETLADRFCVAQAQRASSLAGNPYSNLTLSPEFVLDCDATNNGCGGGLLDDAWRYLMVGGATEESCDPYLYCAHPQSPSCEVGPHPPRPKPHKVTCPKACKDSKPVKQFKAKTAYAVASPGDVESIQRELIAHGPVQVGFQVFSDFMLYKNGTYFRTKSAQGPRGGHAVKIVGWGTDEKGVDYWTVANSWSPMWGMKGFFNIRRGTNECGIESTPAAGLVALPDLPEALFI